jgi:ribokinase
MAEPVKRLLVIGNATADFGYAVECLPRRGETILAQGQSLEPGGKGLNQAVAAVRAGADVTFATAIGDDAEATMLRAFLAAEGLDSPAVRSMNGATDRSIVCTELSGENLIVSTDHKAKSIGFDDVRILLHSLRRDDMLLMQGNLSRATTRESLSVAAAAGARVVLNPAPIAWDFARLLQWAQVLVVNEIEAETLSGIAEPEAGAAALQLGGAGAVVVTLGASGALLRTGVVRAIAAPAVHAVDTAGAGDVFVGVLAASLLDGDTLDEACGWAVRAASLSVTRRGTSSSFPTALELRYLRHCQTVVG